MADYGEPEGRKISDPNKEDRRLSDENKKERRLSDPKEERRLSDSKEERRLSDSKEERRFSDPKEERRLSDAQEERRLSDTNKEERRSSEANKEERKLSGANEERKVSDGYKDARRLSDGSGEKKLSDANDSDDSDEIVPKAERGNELPELEQPAFNSGERNSHQNPDKHVLQEIKEKDRILGPEDDISIHHEEVPTSLKYPFEMPGEGGFYTGELSAEEEDEEGSSDASEPFDRHFEEEIKQQVHIEESEEEMYESHFLHEMPGEGFYNGEHGGESRAPSPYMPDYVGPDDFDFQPQDQPDYEEEEHPEFEAVQEPENNVDPQTALDDIHILQNVLKQVQYPKMSLVRSLLHTIACGLATGGPHIREMALEMGVYATVISTWALWCFTGVPGVKILTTRASSVRHYAIRAMVCITPGYPHVLDDLGVEMILQSLANNVPTKTQLEALRVLRNVCTKCEKNRQRFAEALGFFDCICDIIRISEGDDLEQIVKEWCGAVEAFLIHDDLDVPEDDHLERKRIIYHKNILPWLAQFLSRVDWEVPTMNSIMVVLETFATNENFGLHIDLGGVIPSIYRIITSPGCISHVILMKNTLSCLRYMVATKDIRSRSASMGMIRHVLIIMHIYKWHPDVLEAAMYCCFYLTMKNVCQTALFVSLGGVHLVIDEMQRNMDHPNLVKAGILTLRCIAVNGLNKGKNTIINDGGDEALRGILKKYPNLEEKYMKPLFKDLGIPIKVPPPTPKVHSPIEEPSVEVLLKAATPFKNPFLKKLLGKTS